MADIFKEGILYMDDINDSSLFSEILEEQEISRQKNEEEEKKLKEEQKLREKTEEVKRKTKECLTEIKEKLKTSSPEEILFNEENRIICSNGYGIEVIEKDFGKIINLVIPDNF